MLMFRGEENNYSSETEQVQDRDVNFDQSILEDVNYEPDVGLIKDSKKIEVKGNSSFNYITSPEIPKGFSMIEQLEATIAIGTALGWDMAGCEKKLESIIAENGEFFGHQ